MGGGLLQLVAYGAQDIYLTGNPQITYFKTVYRRHTNFSMESIEQVWCGDPLCGRATSTISRNGDLVHKLYLQQTINVKTTKEALDNVLECCGDDGKANSGGIYIYNPTHTGIGNIEIEIGGQLIDRHSGKWMEVYSELTEHNSAGILSMVGSNGGTKFQNMSRGGGTIVTSLGSIIDKVGSGQSINIENLLKNEDIIFNGENCINTKFDAYVPLRFWFCRNPGLALPLIALQYHEVKVNLELNKNIVGNEALCFGNQIQYECNRLFADYIYLDTDERRRFAQVSHEYLIEQVQYINFKNTGGDLNLNFNHPVKEIIWTGGQNDRTGLFGKLPGSSTDYIKDDYYNENNVKYNLELNGQQRMSERPLEYYTKQQVYDYHTGNPVGSGDPFIRTECCLKYNTNYIDPHSYMRANGTINNTLDEKFNNVLYVSDIGGNDILSKRINTERVPKSDNFKDFPLFHENFKVFHLALEKYDDISITLLYDTENFELFYYNKTTKDDIHTIESVSGVYMITKDLLSNNFFFIKENIFSNGVVELESSITQPLQFITSEKDKAFNNKEISKSTVTPKTIKLDPVEDGIYVKLYESGAGTTGGNVSKTAYSPRYKLNMKTEGGGNLYQIILDQVWDITPVGKGIFIGFEKIFNKKAVYESITFNYGIGGKVNAPSVQLQTTDIDKTPNDLTKLPSSFHNIPPPYWLTNGGMVPYFNVTINGSTTENYLICSGSGCNEAIPAPGVVSLGNIATLVANDPNKGFIILASSNISTTTILKPEVINIVNFNTEESFKIKNYSSYKDETTATTTYKEIDVTTNIIKFDCKTGYQEYIFTSGGINSNVSFTLTTEIENDRFFLFSFNSDIIKSPINIILSPITGNIKNKIEDCKKGLSDLDPEKKEYINTQNCNKKISGTPLELDLNSSYLKINFSINDCLVSNLGLKAEVFHEIKEYQEDDNPQGPKTFSYSASKNSSGLITINNSSGESISGVGILLDGVEPIGSGDTFFDQFIPIADSHIIKLNKNATYTSVRTFISFIPSSSMTINVNPENGKRYWPPTKDGLINQPPGSKAFPYTYIEWDYDHKSKVFFPDITNVDSFSFPIEMTLSADKLHVPGYCGINIQKANGSSIYSDMKTRIDTLLKSMDQNIISSLTGLTGWTKKGLIQEDKFNITDQQNVSYTFICPPNKSDPVNFKVFLDYFDDYIKLSTSSVKGFYNSGVDITNYNCVEKSDLARIAFDNGKGKTPNICQQFNKPTSPLNGNNIKRTIYREHIDTIVKRKAETGHIIIGDPKSWLTSHNKFSYYSLNNGSYTLEGDVPNCSGLCGDVKSNEYFLRFEIKFTKVVDVTYQGTTYNNTEKFSYWLPFELINNNSINILGNDVLWNKFIQVIINLEQDNKFGRPKTPLLNDYWKFYGENALYSYNPKAIGLANQFIWAPGDKSVDQVGASGSPAMINGSQLQEEDYNQLRPDIFCNIFITSICRGVIHLPNKRYTDSDLDNSYKNEGDIISNVQWDNPNVFYGRNNSLGNKLYGIAGQEILPDSKNSYNIKKKGYAQAYHMYSAILHDNAYDRRIYALSFDDTGDRASYLPIQFDSDKNQTIDLKVNIGLSSFNK